MIFPLVSVIVPTKNSTPTLGACSQNKKTRIVIGAASGYRYCDNSKYLHLYLQTKSDWVDVIWLTRSTEVFNQIKNSGAEVYYTYSLNGIMEAIKAHVVIRSYSLDDVGYFAYFFPKKKLLINLSHGIPFKRVDTYKRTFINNLFRNIFLLLVKRDADIVISESQKSDEDLRLIYPSESIFLTGAPRTDAFFSIKQEKNSYIRIFYAPTWRDYEYTLINKNDYAMIDSFLEMNQMQLYIKWHGSDTANHTNELHGFKNIKLAGDDVTFELTQADILITDYSSIFLDFLILNRPMVFTAHDFDTYMQARGFHYDYNTITPGRKTHNWTEVIDELKNLASGNDDFKTQRIKIRDYFHEFHDGKNSERITNLIKQYNDKNIK